MEDPCCRKIPPDRKLEEGEDYVTPKKSKKEIKDDVIMSDQMEDVEGCHDASPSTEENEQANQGKAQMSYKDSLLGFKGTDFNGIAHGSSDMEEDPLLSDLIDREWKLPEPPSELKHLLNIYPAVPIIEEEFNEECRPWNNALVITVLGIRLNLYWLKEHLSRIWGFSDFELIDLPNNYFVVRFANDENWGNRYKRVLFDGPWVVAQHSILVQRWSPYFDPFHNPLGRIATWVRVPNIPLYCYSKRYMWRLGDMIGRTIKVDLHTIADTEENRAKVTRGRFARICVEIDLRKRLVPRIFCTSSLFNIEYEGLGLICFSCGRYGHRKEECPWKKSEGTNSDDVVKPTQPMQNETPATSIPAKENQFGPWMFVQKSSRARVLRRDGQGVRKEGRGSPAKSERKGDNRGMTSRFAAIADIGERVDGTIKTNLEKGEEEIYHTDRGKALVIYEEKKGVHGKDEKIVGPQIKGPRKDGATGKVWVKGKENIKPTMKENKGASQLVNAEKSLEIKAGKQNNMGQEKKVMGLRVHNVVQGSLKVGKSNIVDSQRIQIHSDSPSGEPGQNNIPMGKNICS